MNKVAKNALVVICSSVLAQFFAFLTLSFCAKRLGKPAFGQISTVQSIITYFTLFVLFGLNTYGTREIAKDKNRIKIVVGDILVFRIILFIISFALLAIVSTCIWKFNHDGVLAILLILYGLTLLPMAMSIDWVYSGLQKMEYNSVYNILKSGIPFVLVYIFLKEKTQLYFVPLFTVLALVMGTIFQFFVYFSRERLKIMVRLNKKTMLRYINFGLPFIISGILAMINGNVDRVVIYFSRGSAEAGIYASGYNIISFLINVVGMIFIPIFPVMITYFNGNAKDKLNELMNKTSKILAAFIIPVALGGIILSKQIIILIYDKTFLASHISFSILLVYVVILFFRELYGYGLNACNLEKKYVKAVAVSAVANLGLNLVLTPKYGMNIAAIITLVSEVINFVMMKQYAKGIIVVSNIKNIVRALFPSLLMGTITILLKYNNVNIIINIFISATVYSLFIFVTKYITIGEIKSLLRKG